MCELASPRCLVCLLCVCRLPLSRGNLSEPRASRYRPIVLANVHSPKGIAVGICSPVWASWWGVGRGARDAIFSDRKGYRQGREVPGREFLGPAIFPGWRCSVDFGSDKRSGKMVARGYGGGGGVGVVVVGWVAMDGSVCARGAGQQVNRYERRGKARAGLPATRAPPPAGKHVVIVGSRPIQASTDVPIDTYVDRYLRPRLLVVL